MNGLDGARKAHFLGDSNLRVRYRKDFRRLDQPLSSVSASAASLRRPDVKAVVVPRGETAQVMLADFAAAAH